MVIKRLDIWLQVKIFKKIIERNRGGNTKKKQREEKEVRKRVTWFLRTEYRIVILKR